MEVNHGLDCIRVLHLHSGRQGQTAPVSRPAHFRRVRRAPLTADPSDDEWEAHDYWLAQSCAHHRFILSMFLGKELFTNRKLLCEASIQTGDPIMF
jgi:hypothetical protein